MTKNKKKCDQFDLTSVKSICSGAAPLGPETQHDMQTQYPKWYIKQAYGEHHSPRTTEKKLIPFPGMTESSPVSTMTIWHDIYNGSAGSLVPGQRARLVDADGKDVHDYDTPGELWLQGPNIVLGYLNNVEATEETFGGGWMKTGDEAVIRKSKNGHEHVFITDRIKELIKVKGHQVAPAGTSFLVVTCLVAFAYTLVELEAHILTHHSVADCAVISIPGEDGEEKPKAFVVKSDSVGIEDNDRMLMRDITRHVEKSKAKYKWLTGGVEFIDVVPKSASGKILRRMLRDKEKEERRKKGSKL
jgi:acyl-CoA synthetase (AMP-forming)/AMP-acid ligase II